MTPRASSCSARRYRANLAIVAHRASPAGFGSPSWNAKSMRRHPDPEWCRALVEIELDNDECKFLEECCTSHLVLGHSYGKRSVMRT